MGDKGGSADQSGMYAAMASVEAANKAYALGEQQLDWTKQVWNQEQPLMDASEQQQMALSAQEQQYLEQTQRESAQQYQTYMDTYAPLEQSYAAEAAGWDSPAAIAQARGQAMSDVASQGQAGLNSAAETLRSYGINPSSGRYAALYTGAQPMLGAAEAAAGTTAAQNLRLQKMGLESGAINTGRGLVNATEGLSGVGTGQANSASGSAGGAAQTANQNLSTGSTAMTNPSQWFNSGSNAMGVYTNAVNGYNNSQAAFNEAGASEMGGLGSALGSGLGMLKLFGAAKGGPIGYADGGTVVPGIPGIPGVPSNNMSGMPSYQTTPTQGGGATGIPSAPMMPRQTYAQGGNTMGGDASATPGGTVPAHASPSGGVVTDDVPAMLTAHEFVMPKDVSVWLGHKHLAGLIDKSRQEQQNFANRDDIGGEPTHAIPQHPTFVSRPAHAMGGAIPAYA
jgi:hypothetical protein